MDRRELEWDSKPSGLVLVEMKLPKYHTFVIIMVSKSVSPRRDDFFSLRPQKRCWLFNMPTDVALSRVKD